MNEIQEFSFGISLSFRTKVFVEMKVQNIYSRVLLHYDKYLPKQNSAEQKISFDAGRFSITPALHRHQIPLLMPEFKIPLSKKTMGQQSNGV